MKGGCCPSLSQVLYPAVSVPERPRPPPSRADVEALSAAGVRGVPPGAPYPRTHHPTQDKKKPPCSFRPCSVVSTSGNTKCNGHPYSCPADARVVLSINRFERKKGLPLAIHALSQLVQPNGRAERGRGTGGRRSAVSAEGSAEGSVGWSAEALGPLHLIMAARPHLPFLTHIRRCRPTRVLRAIHSTRRVHFRPLNEKL